MEEQNRTSVRSIEDYLKCFQLLKSASNNESKDLKTLLEEGTDPNFIYEKDGNTALHIAVQNCCDVNVGNLIDKKADIYIENQSCKTPFDIAFANESILTQVDERTRNNKIIEKLQEEIIIESYEIIPSKYNLNRESDQSNNAETEKQVSSTNGKNEANIDNIANECINKKKDKIAFCLTYLKRSNEEQNEKETITYWKANIFIYFLEAFSFNDADCEPSIKALVKDKYQAHFETINTKIFAKKGQLIKLIQKLRTFFTHKDELKISLEDVKKAIKCNSVSEFFVELEKFVDYVNTEIKGGDVTNMKCPVLINILKMIEEKDINRYDQNINNELDELINIRMFNPKLLTSEKKQEIIFNIIVNFAPIHEERVKTLNDFRNRLLHEFHTNENDERKEDFSKTVFNLSSELLRYTYAVKVSKILSEIIAIDNFTAIDLKLREALTEIQNQIKKDKLFLSNEDTQGRLEFVRTSTEQPLNMEQRDLKELVEQYLIIMSNIDDELVEKNNEVKYKIFDHNDRRKIFEKFMKLTRLKRFSPQYNKLNKENFRKEMLDDYGVTGVNFDNVCQLLDDPINFSSENREIKKIINIIYDLINLKNTYNFSYPYLISLYSRASKLKFNTYDQDKDLEIFKNVPLVKQRLFYDKLKKLHKFESIKVTIDKEMTLNVFSLVTNILKTFYLSYSSYLIKFNNIKEIFNDKIFLDYLVGCKNMNSDRIIRKLLKINYTAPYILRLGKQNENGLESVMDREDLKELTRQLLEDDDYIEHLNDLLDVDVDAKVKNDLYKITWKKVSTKNLENWHPILENENHVQNFFEKQKQKQKQSPNHEKAKHDKLVNDFISQLNIIARDLYQEGSYVSYNKALNLLDIGLGLYCENKPETYPLEALNARRIKARIKNRLGQILQMEGELKKANDEYESSLVILKDIITTLKEKQEEKTFEDNMLYLLTLSHVAYTNMLLKDYEKAYISYGTLFININMIAIGQTLKNDEGMIVETRDEFKSIKDILKEPIYKDMLSYSEEAEEYCNYLKVRKSMAYARCASAAVELKQKKQVEKCIEYYQVALDIYKDVYRFQRKHCRKRNLCTLNTMFGISYASLNIAFANVDLYKREQVANARLNKRDVVIRNAVYALEKYIMLNKRSRVNDEIYYSIFQCHRHIETVSNDRKEGKTLSN